MPSVLQVFLTVILAAIFPSSGQLFMPDPYKPRVIAFCAYNIPSFWVPLGSNLLLISVCSYCAFKARSLPDNFHDSKCILACAACCLFMWPAVLLGVLSIDKGPKVDFLLGFALNASCLLMQASLFMPKLYAVRPGRRIEPEEVRVRFYGDTKTRQSTRATTSASLS